MKIALVGNQNSGKTTLFNELTGMNAKIGNWPGVTIEKKTGIIIDTNHEIIDLPGIYSLSPYSEEEQISIKYILEEKPDIIINIVDATSLQRSLYLTTQLLELDCKVIVALNMTDMLEKKGIKIEKNKLEEKLGTSVVKISALKKIGINELIKKIDIVKDKEEIKLYDENIEKAIKNLQLKLKTTNRRFLAIKLIEEEIIKNEKEIIEIVEKLKANYDTDMEEEIASQRYRFIEKVEDYSCIKYKKSINISNKLDKIFLNKWLAIPIFILIMFLVYFLSVGLIGNLTIGIIEKFIENFGKNMEIFLKDIGTPNVIISLVVDGIITGTGAVLKFIPQLMILFICIAILETSGYMSRIAFFGDKIFRKVGLSGKSLIPFIIGSGCSVPGIMGTKIIENESERKMSVILTPFIPCSAKLPIIALFSSYFFPENRSIVACSMYFFSIVIIIISAILMKKYVYKKSSSTYISELPEYKIPSIKYVFQDAVEKTCSFIKRTGSVIITCSIILWGMLSFSPKFEYGIDIENSILAYIGKSISYIFYPMLGKNSWEASISAIQGIVAKEQVISSMSVIAGFSENTLIFENNASFGFFTPLSAYSFMIFNLFSAPCIGAIGAMKKELGKAKETFLAIMYQIIIAWIFATSVYQIGKAIENRKFVNILFLVLLTIFCISNILKKLLKCKICYKCDKCLKYKTK